ncbi:MAG: dihydrofolate reductase [Deltaproteobacteria bacterium]|nr:dihydrofolate reductase [Deltaproteobacteria bacterium]
MVPIWAADDRGGIGRAGDVPWYLPPDIRHFRVLTTGGGQNAVVMGRRTWDSIAPRYRPLKNRFNIVMSRGSTVDAPPGVRIVPDFDAAVRAAEGFVRLWVVGGGQIYRQALARPDCRAVVVTRVAGDFDCDTFVPALPADFALAVTTGELEHGGIRYRFERWER